MIVLLEKTRYSIQKQNASTRLRVDFKDGKKISLGKFTLFDFLDACFCFSPSSKKQAETILTELKQGPSSFSRLLAVSGGKKSSLFLLLHALKKAGLVEQRGRGRPVELSSSFSKALAGYAGWWENWKERV